MEFTTELIMGDWSHDGHGQTKSILIASNLSRNDIKNAYDAGVVIVGFNLTEEVATDYEDDQLQFELMKNLAAHGFTVNCDDDSCSLWTDSFSSIWLFIAGLGNPSFKYEIINSGSIKIGGYGLFS